MDLAIETEHPVDILDITDQVDAQLDQTQRNGIATIFVHHTTAAVVVNEAEAGLLDDIDDWVRLVVDDDHTYRHDRIDDNAAAHLRASLFGPSVTVPIRDGTLALGTWQRLLFIDFDGPRRRRLSVTVTQSPKDS